MRKIKFFYEENNYFRVWLNKLKDKSRIVRESKRYMTKPRKGNTFLIAGANGYCGWATIVQLAFQYPGCFLICCDKEIQPRPGSVIPQLSLKERLERLNKYFDFSYIIIYEDLEVREVVFELIEKYKPHFIINLADGSSPNFNPVMINFLSCLHKISSDKHHLILSTPYKSITDFTGFHGFPITEFKTSKIMCPFNLPILLSYDLATYVDEKLFFNKAVLRALHYDSEPIEYIDKNVYAVSLELFTRAVCQVIRTGTEDRKGYYKFYPIVENYLSKTMIFHILDIAKLKLEKKRLKYLKKEKNFYVCGLKHDIKAIETFLKKTDPPLHVSISYSYKYFSDFFKRKRKVD